MKLVLSIDGGGIRGLIPAMACKALEDIAQKKLCDVFDLMAGTSTGGIIALGLAAALDADKLVALYRTLGPTIFAKPRNWIASLWRPKYDPLGLESVLNGQLPDKKLRDASVPVMVTAYDLAQRAPLILKSWDPNIDVTLCQAARATSAAPTYFAPARSSSGGALIDGGLYGNNPALLAYVEARHRWPDEQIYVFSLGTGTLSTSILYEIASKWGRVGWALPVLDCVFDGVSSSTHNAMEYLAKSPTSKLRYSRLQVALDHTCERMDDASKVALTNLERLGNGLVQQHEKTIKEIRDLSLARDQAQAVPSLTLDSTSKYVRYEIADIVLDDLWKSGFDVRKTEIRNGFTITDLVSLCSNVYYPNVSKDDVRDAVFRARAHAFTVKYSQPREDEDEKMIAPSDLKVAGLAAWTSYFSEILTGLSINVDRDRLIDVGAGHAQANVELYRGAKNLTLVDISADALARAKHSLPLSKTFNASAEDLTGIGNDSVDVYFSFRTYQSTLFDIRSALLEAYRILSWKGWLVLSIPIMYLKKDGTVAKGLLRSGSKEPSMEYASQVAQRIADAASCLQFQSVRVDERSPFELFIVGERV